DGNINGLNRGAMLRIPTADDMRALDAAAAHREIARLRGLPAGSTTNSTPHPHRPVIEPARIAPPPPASAADSTSPAAATPPPAATDSAAAPSANAPAAAETKDAGTAPAAAAATPESAESNAGNTAPPTTADAAAETAAPDHDAAAAGTDAAPATEPAPVAQPAPAKNKAHGESSLLGTLLIPLIVGLLLLLAIAWLYTRWRARQAPPPPPPTAAPKRMPLSRTAASGAAVATAAAGAAAAARTQKLSPQEELDRLQASLSEATRDDVPTQQLSSNTQQLETAATEQTQAVAADLPPVDFDLTGQFATQTVQIDLDANDPVSEADFHLAYGLYDEAALLLRQAAEKEPARTDIGIKLAETYFAAGKATDFERTATELKPKLSAAEWQKLAIMGQQLDPESSLFKEGAQAPASAPESAGVASAADPVLDFNFDAEPSPAAAAAPATEHAPAMTMRADNGLDFKLDDLELPSLDLAKGETPAPAKPDENALDFDLGGFDTPAAAPAASSATAAPATGEHDASAPLDFDLGEFDAPAAPQTAEQPAPAETPVEEFDFDTVSTDASDIAGDEASTKLDLARAYVEMGDHEMARGLLDEVLSQGNAQQKQDAQALIERLA
ncbi:MAG TPA: FimV/HubP family polar landmark protein, partial [Solimonas sp.]|nr:FimV/HubP family polar landmark protein [Solimonas sp.]